MRSLLLTWKRFHVSIESQRRLDAMYARRAHAEFCRQMEARYQRADRELLARAEMERRLAV